MEDLLKKIGDPKLNKIVGSVPTGDALKFRDIQNEFPEYDVDFLWLICYQKENALFVKKYIEENYKKFHQILDSGFLKKLASKNNFGSHMWEMILCDCLSSAGKLEPKEKSGADFILIDTSGQKIQIEAVVSNEATNTKLRSKRPDYSESNIATLSGNVEDLELPILLRFFNSFKQKKNKYRKDIPLIIAINSYKTVGFTSRDNYILRRVLFGLGCETITRKSDGTFVNGLQQTPFLTIPGITEIPTALFRDSNYNHISGIIYTSQNPIGLVPNGFGWSNYGITYVPNPLAKNKVNIKFTFFRKIECNEEIYQESDAVENYKSSLP